MKNYMYETLSDRGEGIDLARRVFLIGRGGGSYAVAILLGYVLRGNKAS